MYPDYQLRKLSEITDCDHKNAQFYGVYSLVGYYYCTGCKSKFCPQEFQSIWIEPHNKVVTNIVLQHK